MRLLDLTLPTPAENLALDDALLQEAEAGRLVDDVLRLWEPTGLMVVLGRSSQMALEVDPEACRHHEVPIVRRGSGGAAIVTGPGCLMYALVLNLDARAHLRAIDRAHAFVLGQLATGLSRSLPGVAHQGTSDLTLGNRKFSGNSMRIKRNHILYHGTLLYDFPLALIGELLAAPPRQPAYRAARNHDEFLTNLPLPRDSLRQILTDTWGADCPLDYNDDRDDRFQSVEGIAT